MNNSIKATLIALSIAGSLAFPALASTTVSMDNKLVGEYERWKMEVKEKLEQQSVKTKDSVLLYNEIQNAAAEESKDLSPVEKKALMSAAAAEQIRYLRSVIDETQNEINLLKKRSSEHKAYAQKAIRSINKARNTDMTLDEYNTRLTSVGRSFAKALSQDLSKSEKQHIKIAMQIANANTLLDQKFEELFDGSTYSDYVLNEGARFHRSLLRAEAKKAIFEKFHSLRMRDLALYFEKMSMRADEEDIHIAIEMIDEFEPVSFGLMDDSSSADSFAQTSVVEMFGGGDE
tara:strand:- start:632 stop:1498 length:867 start_codon:yes stop_codon:yes gene_type:complete